MPLNQQCFVKSRKNDVFQGTLLSYFLDSWPWFSYFFFHKRMLFERFSPATQHIKEVPEVMQDKKKKKRKNPQTFRPRLDLVSKLESRPSFEQNLPCERWVYRVGCVCGYVCLSHTLPVIYSPSNTLPFCLLVNCHGEGGYNGRLQGTINLDTSYLCLRLQGGSLSSCKHD